MGVESVEWFRSYLSNRTQCVSVNNTMSQFEEIACGVPQGSILGPLLFLCYVNDMSTSISSKCKLILYADDSAILFSHKDPEIISKVLGQELENCSNWLVDNKLSLHLGKTECILFGSKHRLSKISDFNVTCNGHTINAQNSVKYLGSVLDKDLSGSSIVDSIVKKVNSRIKFLYRQSAFLNRSMRITLCNSLIQCHFDYACSSWFCGLSKQLKSRLQITQNKVIRFINNVNCRTSVKVNDFKDLGFLNIEERCRQMRLNHAFNIFHNNCPSYLKNNFTKTCDIHRYRNKDNFFVPYVTNFIQSTFYFNCIKDWNSLPTEIKGIKSKLPLNVLSSSFY